MRKNFLVIRDIGEIEKELNEAIAGVLTLRLKGGGNYQIATNFVYLDKNIFVALNKEDEKFENIKLNHYGQFLIYNATITNNSEFNYRVKYISIIGEFREIDDQKLIESVKEKFAEKFLNNNSADYVIPSNLILCILDSKEIQFIIEEGK
jgi:nitroimidazol reductase NimA-like FMN-containing flavoprotein (pyridoxamine 5'-phosphate oxidase superfamily)